MTSVHKLFLYILLATTIQGEAAEILLPPKVTISSPAQNAVEGRDIPLYIIIDHMVQDTIDETSFKLDNSALSVKGISTEKVLSSSPSTPTIGTDLLTTRYKALLSPRKKGLYTIGPVTVSIQGSLYSSNTISLNVQEAVRSSALRLTSKIDAPPHIYKGQEVTFEYRIFFQAPTQLLREELPLLNTAGFFNIGSPNVTTTFVGGENVQTIQQKARAMQPGQYEIPASVIEGMELKTIQQQQFPIPPIYRAETPGTQITVVPFPEPIPANFNGALGSFLWRVVAPDDEIALNHPVSITYVVSGRGELSTVQFPDMKELEGIDNFFWVASSPPIGKEEDGVKKFILEVRPKFSGKLQVPGFAFCSFDPVSEAFIQSSVPPARILVGGARTSSLSSPPVGPAEGDLWPSFSLQEKDATQKNISLRFVTTVLSLCLLLGLAQLLAKKLYDRHKKASALESRTLFYKALMQRNNKNLALTTLKKAFLTRLYELNLTKEIELNPQEISGEGIVQDVKEFLLLIDRQLYQKSESEMPLQDIYNESTSLYNILKGLTRKP